MVKVFQPLNFHYSQIVYCVYPDGRKYKCYERCKTIPVQLRKGHKTFFQTKPIFLPCTNHVHAYSRCLILPVTIDYCIVTFEPYILTKLLTNPIHNLSQALCCLLPFFPAVDSSPHRSLQ